MWSHRVPRNTKKSLNPTRSDRTRSVPPAPPLPSFSTECQTSQSPNAVCLPVSHFMFFPAREISPPLHPRRGPDQPGRDTGRPRASRSPGTAGQARRWATADGAQMRRRPHRPGAGASRARRGTGRGRYRGRTARASPAAGKRRGRAPCPAVSKRKRAPGGEGSAPPCPGSPAPRRRALRGARGARGRGGRSRSLRPRRPPLIQSRARAPAPPPPAPPSRPPVTRETGPPLPAAPLPLAPPTGARVCARGSRPGPLSQRLLRGRAAAGRCGLSVGTVLRTQHRHVGLPRGPPPPASFTLPLSFLPAGHTAPGEGRPARQAAPRSPGPRSAPRHSGRLGPGGFEPGLCHFEEL